MTHFRKLKDIDEPLTAFWERVGELKRLRVILWQLPPSVKKDLGLLNNFLKALPTDVRHALEFRHESWWDAETAEVLARHRAAMVALSHPKLPDEIFPTTDFLYLRFHGLGQRLYQYDYEESELATWAERLRPLLAERELFAFFNNDYEAKAPANARLLRELLA